jgi:DNA-directed RNA polymerase III subunit RPC7
MEQIPVLNEYSAEDKKTAELQAGFAARLRKSPYYIVEQTKSSGMYILN